MNHSGGGTGKQTYVDFPRSIINHEERTGEINASVGKWQFFTQLEGRGGSLSVGNGFP